MSSIPRFQLTSVLRVKISKTIVNFDQLIPETCDGQRESFVFSVPPTGTCEEGLPNAHGGKGQCKFECGMPIPFLLSAAFQGVGVVLVWEGLGQHLGGVGLGGKNSPGGGGITQPPRGPGWRGGGVKGQRGRVTNITP